MRTLLLGIALTLCLSPVKGQLARLSPELQKELLATLPEEMEEEEIVESAGILVMKTNYKTTEEQKLARFYQKIDVPTQRFSFKNPQKAISIQGEGKTSISFPPNAFVDAEGLPVSEPIEIELKEYNEFSEMLSGNLNTHAADGQLLSSGGMVYVGAKTKSGKKLRLAKGKKVRVDIKGKGSQDPYMQPFFINPKTNIWLPAKNTKSFFNHPLYAEYAFLCRLNDAPKLQFSEPNIQPYAPIELRYDFYLKKGKRRYKVAIQGIDEKWAEHKAAIEAKLQTAMASPLKQGASYTTKGGMSPFVLHFQPEMLDEMRSNLRKAQKAKRKEALRFGATLPINGHYLQYCKNYEAVEKRYTEQTTRNYQAIDSLTVLRNHITTYLASQSSDSSFYQRMLGYLNLGALACWKKYNEELDNMKLKYGAYTYFFQYEATKSLNLVSRMGFINCDRFYNDPRPKTAVLALNKSPNDSTAMSYKLILPKRRAMMEGHVSSAHSPVALFDGLPVGEEAVVVAMGYDGANAFYASQSIKVGDAMPLDLKVEPISIAELKKKIQKWDKL